MKKLEFRLWDKANKKMLYYDTDIVPTLTLNGVLENSFIGKVNGKDIILHDNISACYEIMQYTGLRDRHNKKIYEGDVLETEDRIVEVVWHEQAGQWDTNWIAYTKELVSNGITNVEWQYKASAIGNVWENPKLLKGEK